MNPSAQTWFPTLASGGTWCARFAPAGVLLLGLASMLAGGGCATVPTASEPRTWARFYLEAASPDAGTELVLPKSGVRLAVNPQPVLTEADVVNVELVDVELGRCLMFELTPAAARDFHRLSGSSPGRRLALVVDDVPLGARRIDGAIPDGVLFVFAEVPDGELAALAQNLKQSSQQRQRGFARKG